MRGLAQALVLSGLLFSGGVLAQSTLIRGARVLGGPQGTQAADVLIQGDRIAAVGARLSPPAGAIIVEAMGKTLAPALFAGIGKLGVSEISSEDSTVDSKFSGKEGDSDHPEFQVCDSYNPRSMEIPVTRIEGYGFATIAADAGSSFIAGSGCNVRLDGGLSSYGAPVVFIDLTAASKSGAGGSRAGIWMRMRQIFRSFNGQGKPTAPDLTEDGARVVQQLLQGKALLVARVDRAADIQRFVEWAAQMRLRVAIEGGTEAWQVADVLKQHRVPVFLDPSADLPSNFDMLGATLENAALLHAAGVEIAFSQASGSPGSARRLRQFAGIAVANGLPWEVAFAAVTRTPAQILGLDGLLGTIEKGKMADLVLWDGDPLEIMNLAQKVWLGGREIPMRSKQTELRDRYLQSHL